jgi:hypothetical protein
LLNYDHQGPAENVKVRLELSGLAPDLSRWEIKVLSPDAAYSEFVGRSDANLCFPRLSGFHGVP